jgi:plastocyanin
MSRATSFYSFACAGFAAVVVALSTAGCFSDHVTAAPGPTGQELCAASRPGVVRISNFAFSPAVMTVSAGTTITWVNCDADPHTSTSNTGVWDSEVLTQYAKYDRTFSNAGTFPYFCEVHPGMKAQVVVTP